jgi:hypothetical protein
VVSLTECCAHAGYLLAVLQEGSCPETPGPVDRYQLCRAAAETEHKTGLLRTYRLHTVTALVCVLWVHLPLLLCSNAVSDS